MSITDFQLPRRLRATVAKMALTVCPPDVEELGLVETLVDHFEMSMRCLPGFLRKGLVLGLATIEVSSALLPSTLGRTFSRLDKARARLRYRGWRHSRFMPGRKLVGALKSLLLLAYFEQPAIKERIHYHPEQWIDEVSRRRLASYGDEIRRHEEEVLAPNPLINPSRLLRRLRHA